MKLTIAIATILAVASVATAAGKKAAPATTTTTTTTTTAATTTAPAMICMVSGKKAEAKDEAACKAIKGGMWSAEAKATTTTH